MPNPDPEIEQLNAEVPSSFPSESKAISHDEVRPRFLGDKVVAADDHAASTLVYDDPHDSRQDHAIERSPSLHSAVGLNFADLIDNRTFGEEEDFFKPSVEHWKSRSSRRSYLDLLSEKKLAWEPNHEGVSSQSSKSQIFSDVLEHPEHPRVEGLSSSGIERHVVAPAHVEAITEEDEEGPDSTDVVPLLHEDKSPTGAVIRITTIYSLMHVRSLRKWPKDETEVL